MERQYTEQEVTEVIRRAAELQERLAPSDVPRPHGVRESELVRIAVELGLDAKFVRDALADPATFAPEDKGKLTSVDRTLERIAAGLPGSEAFEIALDEFGPSMGVQSGPQTVGDTMTYQSMVALSHCEMLVSKKGGRTRVKVSASTFLPFLAVAMPVALAIAIISSVVGQAAAAVGWLTAAVGMVTDWFVMRRTIEWSNKKVLEKLNALISRLNREAGKVSQEGDGQ